MTALPALRTRLRDGDLRTATLLGLASIPFTLVETLLSSGDILSGEGSGGSLFVACVATGYRYHDRAVAADRACERTALVGFLPVFALWLLALAAEVRAGAFDPEIAAVFGLLVLFLGVFAIVFLGVLCGFLGKTLRRGVDQFGPDLTG